PRHSQFKKHVLQQRLLAIGEVAPGLFLQDGKRVDGLARADNVYTRRIALAPDGAHLDQCAHVKRFHDALEGHFQGALAGLAGGGNHVIDLLARGLVRFTLLALLLSGRWRRQLFFFHHGSGLGRLLDRLLWGGAWVRRSCLGSRRRGRLGRRRSCGLFFFHRLRVRAQLALCAEPATITHYKLWLFFSHTSSRMIGFKR